MNPYTVFWRPSDLSQKEFEAYKAAILKDANSCGMEFEFTESAEDLDVLLDSVRGEKVRYTCNMMSKKSCSVEKIMS